MGESSRWKSLNRGVRTLRIQFLPQAFHPLGNYPKLNYVQAQTRAFLVLSHAEIESYLEEWAKDIARKAEDLWAQKGRTSKPLLSLHACMGETVYPVETLNGASIKDPPTRLSDSLVKMFQGYYASIRRTMESKRRTCSHSSVL